MEKITITEALAELKTIDSRIQKKRAFILNYLYRQEQFKDPLYKEGGSFEAIRQERQSINDLQERKVALRRAIQNTNSSTSLTLEGVTRTVADWLVWRREVAPLISQFYNEMNGKLSSVRQEAMRKGVMVTSSQETASPNDVIVNIDERELSTQIEMHEKLLGDLDGKLSLLNATTFVEL